MPEAADFQQRMRKVEELVHEIESQADPLSRQNSIDLVSLLMELHATGLERLMELLAQQVLPGKQVVDRLADDPLVASLLLLHGLHPVDMQTRVVRALDKVRPYLKSHGGNVELLGIDDGVVRLRLEGSCNGCPSSSQTLKNSIEDAINEFAPDVLELRTEGVSAARPMGGFVPLEQLV
jgi:Fe-S cluster biogenesis protein NfuA